MCLLRLISLSDIFRPPLVFGNVLAWALMHFSVMTWLIIQNRSRTNTAQAAQIPIHSTERAKLTPSGTVPWNISRKHDNLTSAQDMSVPLPFPVQPSTSSSKFVPSP